MSRLTKGFVYATTGADYTALARRSARNLRQAHPNVQIDLYTDQHVTDAVFNRIYPVQDNWFRPKMEALLRSRFDVTVLLDSDTIPLAHIDELFRAVEGCDLAACLSTGRPLAMYLDQPEIPRSFPYLNAGVMVVRRNRRTQALIREWRDMVRRNDLPKDQPPLRWLLYHRRIRFQVLPMEYNLVNLDLLDQWQSHFGAPRLLHVQKLHDADPGDPETPFHLGQVLGEARRDTVRYRQAREAHRRANFVPPSSVTGTPTALARRMLFRLQSLWEMARCTLARRLGR
ncbi:putative nucleotide-diphospho-sugar transferase [Neogemmobacter tilapiae]|uniref:Nucleotide-diphospho-sugar transferase domain-containing protein n=1 Tax=Neogemmobacter tilapiae TaxID=875041 RepID=A0A918TMN4_9RHOB|nr:putative nucleotide-diphospho-sugar transferase [Gemmobacter tilapiae]GHC52886.1 hypothetical protein GCM10007315_14340 [Gemmobacter tilapiae]